MTQYYSRVDREFNGGSKIITVPFPYIKREDIEVLIDDNVITEWSWLNDSQITINTKLISGNILSVCRTTEIDEKIVDYKNMGMVLNEDNLNASQNQLLYSIQELYDNNEVFKQDTNKILIDNKTELENTLEANKQELITAQETFENEINLTLLKNKQEVDTRITEFENNVNSTIDEVLEAANKINELEESVEIATEAAELANQKAEELKETAETISTQLIENTGKIEEAIASFDTKAGIDLSNLSATGQAKFNAKANIGLDNLSATGQAKFDSINNTLNAKVNKSGDTMTGSLNIKLPNGQYALNIHTDGMTGSSGESFGDLRYLMDNKGFATLRGAYLPSSNQSRLHINMYDIDAGVSKGGLFLAYDATNGLVFNFPRCTTKATTTSTAKNDKVAVVVQNYVNGTSWYRVWSDGWIEQGGVANVSGTTQTTINLLKAFSNTNYTVTYANGYDSIPSGTHITNVGTKKTNSFIRYGSNSWTTFNWYACGY